MLLLNSKLFVIVRYKTVCYCYIVNSILLLDSKPALPKYNIYNITFSRNILAGFIYYCSQILAIERNVPHQLQISILGSCLVCVREKRDCEIFCDIT